MEPADALTWRAGTMGEEGEEAEEFEKDDGGP
jgi:hypothetical protein